MNNFCLWKKWARDGWISPHGFTWSWVCVPTLLRRADVAEHEIGPLVTNTWPLIFTSHFPFSSTLLFITLPPCFSLLCSASSPPRPSITSLSPLSPSPSHFPSIHSLSSITFSIPHSIFSACPLSFFPDLIIYFFFSHILRLMHTFQSFPKVLRTLYTLCTVSVLIQTQNVTVLQYNCALTCCAINQNLPPFSCIAFHSPSSGNVVWCL